MGGLLKANLIQMKRSRAFIVCVIISLCFGIFMALLYSYAWQNNEVTIQTVTTLVTQYGMDTDIVDEAFGMLPKNNLWAYINILLSDGSIIYIAAVVVSSLAAAEYTSGTLKNLIARGYSRLGIFSAKLISLLIASYIIAFAYVAGGSVVGLILYGSTTTIDTDKMLTALMAYICLFAALGAMYFMIATICRRSGASIAVSIVVPLFIASVFSIMAMAWKDITDISQYWIINQIVAAQNYVLEGSAWIPFVCALGYFGLSCMVGYAVFSRQDIR